MANDKDDKQDGHSVLIPAVVGFLLGCAAGAGIYHVAKPRVELVQEQRQERREVAALMAAEQRKMQAQLAEQVRAQRNQNRLASAAQRELAFQRRLPGRAA